MTVGEFERYMLEGGVTLAEASYRIALAESLDMNLRQLGERMSVPELNDWLVLIDVEAEAERLAQENAARRKN